MIDTSSRDKVFVSGNFDDIRVKHIRFLEEASKLGRVTVMLWSDEAIHHLTGKSPKFSAVERRYFVQAVRYVEQVHLVSGNISTDTLPIENGNQPDRWVVLEESDTPQKKLFCAQNKIQYTVLRDCDLDSLMQIPVISDNAHSHKKKVVVTGCFDWLHSGHVRFFEETSALGDLTVILGHDDNVLLLKGEGHPMFPQNERRYMVQSIRYVKQALISTGSGWMDAEPEIATVKPDLYVVNEDGDKPEKRAFCETRGIQYVILKRLPKEGLPKRESTKLRGF